MDDEIAGTREWVGLKFLRRDGYARHLRQIRCVWAVKSMLDVVGVDWSLIWG